MYLFKHKGKKKDHYDVLYHYAISSFKKTILLYIYVFFLSYSEASVYQNVLIHFIYTQCSVAIPRLNLLSPFLAKASM